MDTNIIKEILINSNVDSIVYIGKVKDIAEIYYEMLDEDYHFFEEDDYEIEDILYDLEGEDIISISKIEYEYGEIEYFIKEIFDDEGDQIYDYSDVVLIDGELVDELELDAFEGKIMAINIAEDTDDLIEDSGYDANEDDEFEDMLEDITEVLLEDLSDDELCPHCTIKNSLEDVWAIGYEQGYNDAVLEMKEKLNDMDDLLL